MLNMFEPFTVNFLQVFDINIWAGKPMYSARWAGLGTGLRLELYDSGQQAET